MDFIQELKTDIIKYKKKCKNSQNFIKDKSLVQINLKNVPINIYIGVLYLIKNNTIIEINNIFSINNIDNNTKSKYIEYIFYKTPPITATYKSIITFINIELNDISNFNNTSQFLEKDEIITYSTENTNKFISILIKNGFLLYCFK
jgi:hypothetical protein